MSFRFRLILNEFSTLVHIGDIALVAEIRSSGVRLFHTLMSEYTTLRTCPPVDKFMLIILQSIGNVCIIINSVPIL